MQNYSLLLLGTIFTFGAIIVYYYGRKKDNNNALLWALFPFFHGLHEFVDYYSEINSKIIFTRLEVFLALISSLVLLAVCIEFLGQEHNWYGKLTSLLLLILFSYFLFVIPDDVFSELYDLNHVVGPLTTNFFQFIYGILFIFISLIALIYNLLQIKTQNEKTGIVINYMNVIIVGTIVSMVFFILFEGFSLNANVNSLNYQIFSSLEAIFAFLFLLFPIIFMSISKPGLNFLIAFNPDDGRFLMAYDFKFKNLISLDDDNSSLWINTASFLSALTAFSKTDSTIGGLLSSINTEKGVFILTRSQKYTLALNTRITTKNLRLSLANFMTKASLEIEKSLNTSLEIKLSPELEKLIILEFLKYI